MHYVNEILEFELIHIGEYTLHVFSLLVITLIIVITKSILWLLRKALSRKSNILSTDQGSLFALYQIGSYIIWIIAIILVLEAIGVNLNKVWLGSAALMVGIGLGLQQTFNDIISGIILLFEGSTKVGDVLEVDGDVLVIESIGFRTSKGMNRDEIVMIIPNSQITTNKVINWSHQNKKTRFKINVGVAYGSDLDFVEEIIKESILSHPEIKETDFIEARFVDFGSSSLDFQVLFFSKNIFRIEKLKSEIRKIINKKFNENNISIPFQQIDLHVKTPLNVKRN